MVQSAAYLSATGSGGRRAGTLGAAPQAPHCPVGEPSGQAASATRTPGWWWRLCCRPPAAAAGRRLCRRWHQAQRHIPLAPHDQAAQGWQAGQRAGVQCCAVGLQLGIDPQKLQPLALIVLHQRCRSGPAATARAACREGEAAQHAALEASSLQHAQHPPCRRLAACCLQAHVCKQQLLHISTEAMLAERVIKQPGAGAHCTGARRSRATGSAAQARHTSRHVALQHRRTGIIS